jgi:hypothetical protein
MKSDYLYSYCERGELERQKLMDRAKEDGKERATNDYPYAVYRDKAKVEQVAAQAFQEWFINASDSSSAHNKQFYLNKWRPFAIEGERLYRAAWIAGYEETVAKKDEAARPKPTPQPQPTAQPATSISATDTITLNGVTFRVRNIKRGTDEVVYQLEINHPGVTNGVETLTFAHAVSDTSSTSSSYGSASGSSSGGYHAEAHTTAYETPPSSSASPQKKNSGFSIKDFSIDKARRRGGFYTK